MRYLRDARHDHRRKRHGRHGARRVEGAGGRARVYTTGLFGTFRHITRTEGLHGLYRGILPEYYKVVPSVGICFMTYETLKKLFADILDSS